MLLNKNIVSYIASHYHEYSHANGTRYACTGSPAQVANTCIVEDMRHGYD